MRKISYHLDNRFGKMKRMVETGRLEAVHTACFADYTGSSRAIQAVVEIGAKVPVESGIAEEKAHDVRL